MRKCIIILLIILLTGVIHHTDISAKSIFSDSATNKFSLLNLPAKANQTGQQLLIEALMNVEVARDTNLLKELSSVTNAETSRLLKGGNRTAAVKLLLAAVNYCSRVAYFSNFESERSIFLADSFSLQGLKVVEGQNNLLNEKHKIASVRVFLLTQAYKEKEAEAVALLLSSFRYYHSQNDSLNILQTANAISVIYNTVSLFDEAIAWMKTADQYVPKSYADYSKIKPMYIGGLSALYIAAFALDTTRQTYLTQADSVLGVFNHYTSDNATWHYTRYMLQAELNYYRKQYTQALKMVDSGFVSRIDDGFSTGVYDPSMAYGAKFRIYYKNEKYTACQNLINEWLAMGQKPLLEMYDFLFDEALKKREWTQAKNLLTEKSALEQQKYKIRNRGHILEVIQKYKEIERQYELSSIRQKNTFYWTIAALLFIILSIVVFSLYRVKSLKVAKNKATYQAELAGMENILVRYENDLLQSEEKRLEDRKKIGTTLHNSLISELASLNFMIAQQKDQIANQIEKERLMIIQEEVEQIYKDTRHFSHLLFNKEIDEEETLYSKNLINYLQNIEAQFALIGALSISSNANDDIWKRLAEMQTKTLFGIIKECITNTLKHAHAKQVRIVLSETVEQQEFILHFADDGRGDAGIRQGSSASGIGFKSLQEKIASLMGRMEFFSDKGMHLTFVFPQK